MPLKNILLDILVFVIFISLSLGPILIFGSGIITSIIFIIKHKKNFKLRTIFLSILNVSSTALILLSPLSLLLLYSLLLMIIDFIKFNF